MNCLGCSSVMTGTVARAHTEECRRRLEECLAQDEDTIVRSETAKHCVDGFLAGRVEPAEKATISVEADVDMPSSAISSAPAASSSSAPAVEVPNQGEKVPDHGGRSPQVQDTKAVVEVREN